MEIQAAFRRIRSAAPSQCAVSGETGRTEAYNAGSPRRPYKFSIKRTRPKFHLVTPIVPIVSFRPREFSNDRDAACSRDFPFDFDGNKYKLTGITRPRRTWVATEHLHVTVYLKQYREYSQRMPMSAFCDTRGALCTCSLLNIFTTIPKVLVKAAGKPLRDSTIRVLDLPATISNYDAC